MAGLSDETAAAIAQAISQSMVEAETNRIAAATLKVIVPRIGGVTSGVAWTGGSNVPNKRRSHFQSELARRPQDVRSAGTLEQRLIAGLPVSKQIGSTPNSGVPLMSWIGYIEEDAKDKGYDTVFYILQADGTEVNPFQSFGSVTSDDMTVWVDELKTGIPFVDDAGEIQLLPVCSYDLNNLRWSGRSIRDSITPEFWELLQGTLTLDASGPEIFMAVVIHLQQATSGAVRLLITELQLLSLKNEPGQNVQEFNKKVTSMCRTISGTGQAPTDLRVMVCKLYLGTDVRGFDNEAMTLHSNIETAGTDKDWRYVTQFFSSRFVWYRGQDMWTPLPFSRAGAVKPQTPSSVDQIGALTAQLNALQAQVSNGSNSGCHICGSPDHFKAFCPQRPGGDNGGRGGRGRGGRGRGNGGASTGANAHTGPNDPQTKFVDGVKWSFCANPCNRWTKGTKAHITSEHVVADRNQQQPVIPSPAKVHFGMTPSQSIVTDTVDTTYVGGSLGLKGGFLGVGLMSDTNITVAPVLVDDTIAIDDGCQPCTTSVCADDFFHLAISRADWPDPPPLEEHEHPHSSVSGDLHLARTSEPVEEQPKLFMLGHTWDTEPNHISWMSYLCHVGKTTNAGDVGKWAHSVRFKLDKIGIKSCKSLRMGLPTINTRLDDIGLSRFHAHTLHVFNETLPNDEVCDNCLIVGHSRDQCPRLCSRCSQLGHNVVTCPMRSNNTPPDGVSSQRVDIALPPGKEPPFTWIPPPIPDNLHWKHASVYGPFRFGGARHHLYRFLRELCIGCALTPEDGSIWINFVIDQIRSREIEDYQHAIKIIEDDIQEYRLAVLDCSLIPDAVERQDAEAAGRSFASQLIAGTQLAPCKPKASTPDVEARRKAYLAACVLSDQTQDWHPERTEFECYHYHEDPHMDPSVALRAEDGWPYLRRSDDLLTWKTPSSELVGDEWATIASDPMITPLTRFSPGDSEVPLAITNERGRLSYIHGQRVSRSTDGSLQPVANTFAHAGPPPPVTRPRLMGVVLGEPGDQRGGYVYGSFADPTRDFYDGSPQFLHLTPTLHIFGHWTRNGTDTDFVFIQHPGQFRPSSPVLDDPPISDAHSDASSDSSHYAAPPGPCQYCGGEDHFVDECPREPDSPFTVAFSDERANSTDNQANPNADGAHEGLLDGSQEGDADGTQEGGIDGPQPGSLDAQTVNWEHQLHTMTAHGWNPGPTMLVADLASETTSSDGSDGYVMTLNC